MRLLPGIFPKPYNIKIIVKKYREIHNVETIKKPLLALEDIAVIMALILSIVKLVHSYDS